ncbi:hypothetical protein NBRC116594_29530 [Shimia sp. NS0008-38b]
MQLIHIVGDKIDVVKFEFHGVAPERGGFCRHRDHNRAQNQAEGITQRAARVYRGLQTSCRVHVDMQPMRKICRKGRFN